MVQWIMIVFGICLAAIVWMTDRYRVDFRRSGRWIVALALIGTVSNGAKLFGSHAILDEDPVHMASGVYLAMSVVGYYGIPYAFLMFAISCYPKTTERMHRMLLLLMLLPPLTTAVPVRTERLAIHYPNAWVAVWVGIYVLISFILLIHTYFLETHRIRKRYMLLINWISIPIVAATFAKDYLSKVLGLKESMYMTWSVGLFIVGLTSFFAFKYGLLGVRIRFERERLSSSLQTMVSSSSILNHTLKNEIAKISFQLQRMTRIAAEQKLPEFEKELKLAEVSTKHVLNMVKRIQHHSQEIQLEKEECDLCGLVEQSVMLNHALFEKEGVQVSTAFKHSPVLLDCDASHVTEAISNLITNAVEAMDMDRRLHIEVIQGEAQAVISVVDHGRGMTEEQLAMIFNPYYSTKRGGLNFGLGMTYTYNVLAKHNGRVEVESEVNKGTTVNLIFPK